MSRALALWREPVVRDRLLFALFLVVGQVEIWTAADDAGFSGPRPALAAASVVLAGTMLWRRTAALPSALAVITVVLASSAAWKLPDTFASPGIVLMTSAFALGAHATARPAAAGLAIFLAATVVTSAIDRHDLGDDLFLLGIYATVWGGGRIARNRSDLAAQLADRAAVLEHERDTEAARAAAAERARIARELHDVVAHCVNVMVLQAGAERRLVEGERPQTGDTLRSIEDTGRQALGELRRLLGVVRDHEAAPLEPQPRLADLEALARRTTGAGVTTTLQTTGDVRPLAPGLELSAYRIVQEALTNVLKHAPSSTAVVAVRYRPDVLEVEVTNSAPAGPIAANRNGAGAGIVGMRERVTLFGGSLDAAPARDGGYRVQARLRIDPGAG